MVGQGSWYGWGYLMRSGWVYIGCFGNSVGRHSYLVWVTLERLDWDSVWGFGLDNLENKRSEQPQLGLDLMRVGLSLGNLENIPYLPFQWELVLEFYMYADLFCVLVQCYMWVGMCQNYILEK